MHAKHFSVIVVTVFASLQNGNASAADYPLEPVPFNEVEMTSDFWRPRLVTQRETLVPFAFERTRPGVEHLKAARDFLAGKEVKGHRPHRFIDSDLYKVMEGAAYLLQLRRDPELEGRLDELADLIAAAQHSNGYLYPSHTTGVGKHPFNHGTAGRAPWFGTACCPSNMARLIPQVPGMMYAHDDRDLYLTFYAESNTTVEIGGVRVRVHQETLYPNDGKVSVFLAPEKPTRFRLLLRIPTWTRDRFVPGELYRFARASDQAVTVTVNGRPVATRVEKGFVSIDREWRTSNKVELQLPMPVRVSECHAAVTANTNRVALTRGPFVLCAEGVDNGGATQRLLFDDLAAAKKAVPVTHTFNTISFPQVRVPAKAVTADGSVESTTAVLTPYYAWNNRGVSSMTVWFPRQKELAVYDPHRLPNESIFASITASHTSPLDTTAAVGDGKEPRWSSGKTVPRWSSRPQKGTPQWVEARFHGTKSVRSVGVYWMHDRQDVWLPRKWSLEVEQDGRWQPFQLHATDRYGAKVNQYNVVRPAAPLSCDAIRIHMTPLRRECVGILEVQVAFE